MKILDATLLLLITLSTLTLSHRLTATKYQYAGLIEYENSYSSFCCSRSQKKYGVVLSENRQIQTESQANPIFNPESNELEYLDIGTKYRSFLWKVAAPIDSSSLRFRGIRGSSDDCINKKLTSLELSLLTLNQIIPRVVRALPYGHFEVVPFQEITGSTSKSTIHQFLRPSSLPVTYYFLKNKKLKSRAFHVRPSRKHLRESVVIRELESIVPLREEYNQYSDFGYHSCCCLRAPGFLNEPIIEENLSLYKETRLRGLLAVTPYTDENPNDIRKPNYKIHQHGPIWQIESEPWENYLTFYSDNKPKPKPGSELNEAAYKAVYKPPTPTSGLQLVELS